ncbi:MAG: acyl-CoA thioesterase [Spirochaetales bacterium]|nr:acyl-CoA thioesterase [Spirochaetales bacterium]
MNNGLFSLRVRPHECDAYGHVNNAVYLNYLETARLELVRGIGLDYASLVRSGFGIWVAEAQLQFLVPAFPDEELLIESIPLAVKNVSLTLEHKIRKQPGDLVLLATLKLALMNTQSGKPARLPEVWMEGFKALSKSSNFHNPESCSTLQEF